MKTLVLLGPTAVGKTKLSIELAKTFNAEIISADSMQVYRGMDIGTAKPTLEERQGIPHHLIDVRNPDEEWTVSDFVGEVQNLKVKIKNKGKIPIIVGGTGLYLWSLLEGFAFPISPADKEVRARLEQRPTATLYAQLSMIDPEAAGKIHANDKKRIIRALEVYELTGKPISELQRLRQINSPHLSVGNNEFFVIGLNLPREELYPRINARVDNMIAKDLIDEVKGLLAKGFSKGLNSFQALGYKEVIEYLDGKWTKDQLIDELKKRTRHFARRQMTWFRRFKDVQWFSPDEKDAIIKLCGKEIKK
ncbi:MAG: tRNA (adenosine(37)-N6)-dimethylallyltransferase MiaA [Candidatus Margulisbacteria bacterium]|nr:tRNA (adenosine(37)-N6)-dimethylallyltransferase MiaA [Candidatus Margulisiibacteriota bacterium]